MIKKAVLACVGSAALLAAGAGPAFAGEVNGNQQPIPAPQHAQSVCVYSGQNNFNEETEPGRTQSFGQIVRLFGPQGGVPGTACNGHLNPLQSATGPVG